MLLVIWGITGLWAGTVVNSLADNLPPDAAGVRRWPRRPHCASCGRAHRPAYWLAAVAWLARAGRCEHCGARRRIRPVVVEVLMAAALPYLWVWAGGSGSAVGSVPRFVAAAVVVTLFVLVTVIDIEHRLILRVVVLPAAVLVVALVVLLNGTALTKTLLGGVAGYAILLGIYLFAQLYTWLVMRLRGQALEEVAFGGGDVNLGAVVGLAVGWPGVLLAVTIAIFTGALFSLGVLVTQLVQRRYNPHAAIPYGPFLVLGALLVYLYGQSFAAWYLAR